MDNLGILSGLPMPNLLFPCCSPFMYSALVMATLYGCRCLTCKKTNALKRSMAMSDSQRSDMIFSQMSKCPRLDHQQTSPVRLLPSPADDTLNSRKCTGTQTLFSSFVPAPSLFDKEPTDPYFRKSFSEEEPCFILDLDRHMMGKSCPVRNGKTRTTSCNENEINNIPLNLTVPSVKASVRPPTLETSQVRWSPTKSSNAGQKILQTNGNAEIPNVGVYNGGSGWRPGEREGFRPIKKLDNSKMNHHDIWNEGKPLMKTEQQSTSLRKFSSSVECEKGVEEHFKRSLGKDYPQRLGKSLPNTTVSVASAAEPAIVVSTSANSKQPDCQSNMSVTGAVDDHFAKSLGQTWTKLKSQNAPIDQDGQPGSVDDHFAKALGDMWFKIKAEKNNS